MSKLLALIAWLDAHALTIAAVLATLTGILRAVYALASRILAPYPRARAFVEAVAAMAPDVLRFVQQLFRLATGRDLPSTQPANGAPPVVPAPAPLATLAEDAGAVAVFDSRASLAPPPPAAPTPLRAVALTGVVADDNAAAYELARREVASHGLFDATARQEIAADVVAEAQRLTAAPLPLVHTPASALHGARWEPANDPNDPKEPA